MIDPGMIEAEIPHLRRYARALTGGQREAADDLVQDTLERAWRKRHLWRPSGRLRSWLFRILYRQFLDSRPSSRQKSDKLITLDDVWYEMPGTRPLQEVSLHCRDVMQAIDRLPERQRSILLLVAIEQPDYREGARMLGIKLGTFRSRLYRARERLDQELNVGDPASTTRDSNARPQSQHG